MSGEGLQPAPAGTIRAKDRSTLVLRRRWAGTREVLGFLVLALLLDGAAFVGLIATLEEGPLLQRVVFGLFELFIALCALFFDYATLAMLVNHTEVRVDGRRLEVRNLPLSAFTHRLSLPTFKVASLRVVAVPGSRNSPAAHRLEVVTAAGDAVLVDSFPDAATATWFREQIEARLAEVPGREAAATAPGEAAPAP